MNNPKLNQQKLSWAYYIEKDFDPKTGQLELVIGWRDPEGHMRGTWLRINPKEGPVYEIAENSILPLTDLNKANRQRS